MVKSGFLIKEPICCIGDSELVEAQKKYQDAKNKGIIISDYSSNNWILSDQRSKINIIFDRNINELKNIRKSDAPSVDHILDNLKIFFLLRFGTCSLLTLKDFVYFTLKEIEESNFFEACKITPLCSNAAQIMYYIEFIRLICPEKKEYISECERKLSISRKLNAESKKGDKHPCELNEFQSYFRFDELLRDWWTNCKEEEKRYYYPLYLFWIITTILPMRVTEFCLTPYNCIRNDDGRYYLTIRRSRLKGGYNDDIKIHYYSIEEDYNRFEYEIPEWLYNEINYYKTISQGYDRSYELLFSMEFLYKNKKNSIGAKSDDRVFDREVLGDILNDFYVSVVNKKYKTINEECLMDRYMDEQYGLYQMEENEIMKVLPKHTRHLSMINLIMRGCNPMMIKEFAGHSKETTSCNYYGNVSKTVRCATKTLYDKSKSIQKKTASVKEVNPLALMINKEDDFMEVDEGRCYSKNFINGDPTDCTVCGGVCINCRYCVPNKKDHIFKDINCDQLDEELVYLMKMLSTSDIEDKLEEYQIRMQRLERDLGNYAERYFKFLVEEDEDA